MRICDPRVSIRVDDPFYRPTTDRDAAVTVYLLLELRKANRTIQRLREVGLAAQDENAVSLRAALAALHARDLERRQPISRAESRRNASLSAAGERGSLRARPSTTRSGR